MRGQHRSFIFTLDEKKDLAYLEKVRDATYLKISSRAYRHSIDCGKGAVTHPRCIHFTQASTAEWAVLVGQHEVAVFLDAACKEQQARAGQHIHGPRQVERFEHEGLALNADTRERLLSASHGLGYDKMLESVHAFLTSGQARIFATQIDEVGQVLAALAP